MSLLTILIPSLDRRRPMRDRLENNLRSQIQRHRLEKDVRYLFYPDNGVLSIGYKRNELSHDSRSPYSVFIDDDDLVPEWYLSSIISLLKDNPDGIGFKGEMSNLRTRGKSVFVHKAGENYEERERVYYRPLNHLNPMRTQFFKEIGFPEINHGEDKDFCMRLKESGLIKESPFIDKTMYYYLWNPVK